MPPHVEHYVSVVTILHLRLAVDRKQEAGSVGHEAPGQEDRRARLNSGLEKSSVISLCMTALEYTRRALILPCLAVQTPHLEKTSVQKQRVESGEGIDQGKTNTKTNKNSHATLEGCSYARSICYLRSV